MKNSGKNKYNLAIFGHIQTFLTKYLARFCGLLNVPEKAAWLAHSEDHFAGQDPGQVGGGQVAGAAGQGTPPPPPVGVTSVQDVNCAAGPVHTSREYVCTVACYMYNQVHM